ncbi:HAD family phosphatase [Pseudomonadales bacterium]|nr:HAD family phosphatase [Pseudomonadales bacterium]MDB4068840.1 HAD family phosphatase [Pseudomonadales bacterium]MDB4149962.1 HAD family phosphatase [Pseudomonadales bacterium]MDB9867619.1 HAD family phosphatase [Pseudomonadales bacterium]MDB9879074.1 HAD family phosphatase [Pseudomonadales bacterium]
MPYQPGPEIASNLITTVIFDLGNVLLDWNTELVLAGLKLPNSALKLLRDELFGHQDWLDMDHGKVAEPIVAARVSTRTGLPISVIEAALQAAKDSLLPIPASVDLMTEIHDRGFELVCLSNMSRETYAHVRHLDFFKLFAGIVISGHEGCMKPGADIFQLTLQRFDLSPTKTLFIDDSLPNILQAQQLGISTLHFKRTDHCYAGIRQMLA